MDIGENRATQTEGPSPTPAKRFRDAGAGLPREQEHLGRLDHSQARDQREAGCQAWLPQKPPARAGSAANPRLKGFPSCCYNFCFDYSLVAFKFPA